MKPALLRPQGKQDILAVTRHYRGEGSAPLARRWVDAIEAALAHVSRFPGSGSPRYSQPLNLEDLRFWQVKRFPYLIFYIERPDSIDVWRVLHGERDLPEWLR